MTTAIGRAGFGVLAASIVAFGLLSRSSAQTGGGSPGPMADTFWLAERCGVWGTGGQPCLDNPVDPIVQFDASGRFLRSFGRRTVVSPHKLDVDHEGNIWVTDMGMATGIGHQVLKFNPQGEIVLRLGTAGIAGAGPNQFQQPTDVAVARNGDIYVADGHGTAAATGNARIVKFNRNGTLIKAWGTKGMGPGQFELPHELDIDSVQPRRPRAQICCCLSSSKTLLMPA